MRALDWHGLFVSLHFAIAYQFRSRSRVVAYCLGTVIVLLFTADHAFPPNLSRYRNVSPEVVDRHGVLLRAFLTRDGYWRMRTEVRDVSPRYLSVLKAYEDKRFDSHWGVDPIALVRAALQYA